MINWVWSLTPPGRVHIAEGKLPIRIHTALHSAMGLPWMPFGAPVAPQQGYSSAYSHFEVSVML